MNITPEIMFKASWDKNQDFECVFWMGVKTTGIFCRPTCTSRKPKVENLEFFENAKDAMKNGYRPVSYTHPDVYKRQDY